MTNRQRFIKEIDRHIKELSVTSKPIRLWEKLESKGLKPYFYSLEQLINIDETPYFKKYIDDMRAPNKKRIAALNVLKIIIQIRRPL